VVLLSVPTLVKPGYKEAIIHNPLSHVANHHIRLVRVVDKMVYAVNEMQVEVWELLIRHVTGERYDLILMILRLPST